MIAVLLSTYNGEKYLHDFLDSLYNQNYEGKFNLFVRDDGSSDNTIKILQEYNYRYGNIRIIRDTNLGPAISYMTIISMVPESYNYYFFADQDDVWKQNKFKIYTDLLKKAGKMPTLLASNFYVTDEFLNVVKIQSLNKNVIGFGNAVVQNVILGATMCLNLAGIKLIKGTNFHAKNIRMHDSWIYLILSYKGKIQYIEEPLIYYRQHGKNFIGSLSKNKTFVNWMKRTEFTAHCQRLTQLKEFAFRIRLSKNDKQVFYAIMNNDIFKIILYFLQNRIVFSSKKRFLHYCLLIISFDIYRKRCSDQKK